MLHWRPASEADLPAIVAIAAQVHPAFPERPEVFAEKLRLYPAGCFIFGQDEGYALSHPWAGSAPKLDSFMHHLPDNPTCYFIHDVALMPAARGHGAIRQLLSLLPTCRVMRLVAVNASAPLWAHMGFRVIGEEPAYGDDAVLMEKA